MKAFSITIISLALTTAVIGNAYYQKKQFYPSVVYITKSNPSMAVSWIFFTTFPTTYVSNVIFSGDIHSSIHSSSINGETYAKSFFRTVEGSRIRSTYIILFFFFLFID